MYACISFVARLVCVFSVGEDEFTKFLNVMDDPDFKVKYPELNKLREGQTKNRKDDQESDKLVQVSFSHDRVNKAVCLSFVSFCKKQSKTENLKNVY